MNDLCTWLDLQEAHRDSLLHLLLTLESRPRDSAAERKWCRPLLPAPTNWSTLKQPELMATSSCWWLLLLASWQSYKTQGALHFCTRVAWGGSQQKVLPGSRAGRRLASRSLCHCRLSHRSDHPPCHHQLTAALFRASIGQHCCTWNCFKRVDPCRILEQRANNDNLLSFSVCNGLGWSPSREDVSEFAFLTKSHFFRIRSWR